jgi:DnaJ domain
MLATKRDNNNNNNNNSNGIHRLRYLALAAVHVSFFSGAWGFMHCAPHVSHLRATYSSSRSTTLIQYMDDHTPTPFSRAAPASPYKQLTGETKPQKLPSKNNTGNIQKPVKKTDDVPREITLYQVLGVAPTATRDEMKQRYNVLARKYHPDAIRNRPKLMFVGTPTATTTTTQDDKEPTFGEISAAWNLLSDERARKKYDRKLLYKRWADQASNIAIKTMEDAAPVMAKMMEDVAAPFLENAALSTASFARAALQMGKPTTKTVGEDTEKSEARTSPVVSVSLDELVAKITLPKGTDPNTNSQTPISETPKTTTTTTSLESPVWTFLKTMFFP